MDNQYYYNDADKLALTKLTIFERENQFLKWIQDIEEKLEKYVMYAKCY
jgi:hypothetical protein